MQVANNSSLKYLTLSSIEYTYTTVIAELGQLGNNDNRYKLTDCTGLSEVLRSEQYRLPFTACERLVFDSASLRIGGLILCQKVG